MAALAGAIVVTGGVNTYAADEGIPKGPEYNGPIMFELPKDYNGPTETTEPKETETTEPKETETTEPKETETTTKTEEKSNLFEIQPNDQFVGESAAKLQGAKDEAKEKLAANGITSEFYLKQVDAAKNIESLNSYVKMLIDEHYKSNPDALRPIEKAEEIEEPGDNIPEDSPFYRQTPFAYRTKEEAEQAAKKALENELLNPGHINNAYEVAQKADGNWDYVLKIVDKSEEKKPEEKPSDPEVKPNPSTPAEPSTPSVPENHYHENDYANIGAGEGTKEDGKKENSKEESKENGKKEDSKEESKENGKKEDSKEESKENGKEEKTGKEGKENTDSPNKKKKEKAALPKAGSEAEILTLAAASLSSVAGAFISLKKRK